MSKPAFNNFSTQFICEALGVEITSINANVNTDQFGVDRFNQMVVELDVTAVSGTTPTLTFTLQTLLPDNVTWSDLMMGPLVDSTGKYVLSFAPTGISSYKDTPITTPGDLRRVPLGTWGRIAFVVAGTTPVFTISGCYVRLLRSPLSISV